MGAKDVEGDRVKDVEEDGGKGFDGVMGQRM